MSATLALPAAKLAIGAAASLAKGVAGALGAESPEKAKARKTAAEFETVFLENMTERLFAGSEGEGPLGENGTGSGIYRSMLTQEYARSLQKAGGLGLADQVMRQLIGIQEQAGATAGSGHVRR